MHRLSRLGLVLVVTTGLATAAFSAQSPTAAPAPGHSGVGVDLAGIDRDAAPGDGFDRYANGAWRARTEIPADRSRIGSFLTAAMLVEQRNVDIIAGASRSNPAPGTDARRIADYHAAFLDRAAIERRGIAPLRPHLERIRSIASRRDLSAALGASMRADVDPLNATAFGTENLFGVFVAQGLQEPNRNFAYLLQGGLGLPDREYYLSETPEMRRVRDGYQAYVGQMLALMGVADAEDRAARIIDLEIKIARAHVDAVAAQDPHRVQTWGRAEFAARAPGIDWDAFLGSARLADEERIIAWHAEPIRGISALVASEPLDTWKDWFAFHTASRMAAMLPQAYDDLRFSFYGRVLAGQQQQRPLDRRAIQATSNALVDAVGKIYVERHFPASAKADVDEMVRNIVQAFDRRLTGLTWMAPETLREARRKVETVTVGIGYPERWRGYSGLEIRDDDAFGNAWRAAEAEYRHQLGKLGRPVDRGEWWLGAHTVNAVFLPLQNAMNFPAGILEAPFYDRTADPAYNYGAIGSVIGHEISHSFDNLGAEFDAEGRLRNWWTSEDMAHFREASQALVRQYDGYEPFAGLHLNGELTLGENIADLAGLAAAYDAYRASLGGRPAPVIGGLTADQRFFLGFASAHRESAREAALRNLIATDSHSPGRYRIETVRNLQAWYDAFDVRPGQALYLAPADRVSVW
ncbi:M13 family metallopeptidase [Sphingosinicella terrae]|uniref:M13 family metallopeptidase n=1 Tax=Sphingosinicella terrae TaxID=2172047 RepID=UPI000E0DE5E5|nr:M13 family metallopeptidase [Sphingosinicella terrae]